MRKKLLLRAVAILALISFTLPAYSSFTEQDPVSPQTQTLNVTINQKAGQADPSSGNPVFRVVFSSPINVSTFDRSDIALTGTATNKSVVSITQSAPNDGTTFDVTTTSQGNGTIIATIPAASSKISTKLFGTTGSGPLIIAKDASGNLYTVNGAGQNITKITPSGTSTNFGSISIKPTALVFDTSGNAFVTNQYAANVTKITPGGVSTIFASTGAVPFDMIIDSSNNLYTLSLTTNVITKITPAGVATAFATVGTHPSSLVMDNSGNIYTANNTSNDISKVTPAGVVSTFASIGSGTTPIDLAFDSSNNLYVANYGSSNVSKITAAGVVSTFASVSTNPRSLTSDSAGNIFVAADSGTVTKITSAGTTALAASQTNLNAVSIATDNSDNIYIIGFGNYLYKFYPITLGVKDLSDNTNQVSTSSDHSVTVNRPTITINQKAGQADPLNALQAKFTVVFPSAINVSTFGASDIVLGGTATGQYVSNIAQVAPNDGTTFEVTVSASTTGTIIANIPAGDLTYTKSVFADVISTSYSGHMAVSDAGNVYVSNDANYTIRKITPAGVVTTIDATPTPNAGVYPAAIEVDHDDNLYVSANNGSSQTVMKITPAGVKTVLGSLANSPFGSTIDSNGNIYTSDANGKTIAKITSAGVSTIMGYAPFGAGKIAVDTDGNVYSTEYIDNTLSKITPNGDSYVIGSIPDFPYDGIKVDSYGNIFTSTRNTNNAILRTTPDGNTTLFANAIGSGLVPTPDGSIFTSGDSGNTIGKVSSKGTLSALPPSDYSTLIIRGDSSGNVYQLSYGSHYVTKFVPTGTFGIAYANGDLNDASESTDNSVTLTDWAPNEFVTTWKTDNPGTSNSNQIVIPTSGVGYNYNVDWGDGNTSTSQTGNATHTYGSPGIYTIKITGTFPSFYMAFYGDGQKLLSVDQWGSNHWASMKNSFDDARNVQFLATDVPDLTDVKNMDYMLSNAISFNSNINNWDTSNVETMNGTFNQAESFNQPLNNWDVSNVTSMSGTFSGTTSFNQPLNNWSVNSVTSMFAMFSGSSFNQNIDGWNVSNVTDMGLMFRWNHVFNQPINNWNVSNVESFHEFMLGNPAFNQPVDNWNTQSAIDMYRMFSDDPAFNQPINTFDTSNVTDMSEMFQFSTAFDQPLNNWDVSNVADMSSMFNGATAFDQPLDSWIIVNVTNLSSMFSGGSGLKSSNYDLTLTAWDDLNLKSGVTFDAGTSKYCNAVSSRAHIISSKSWTITDGGLDCSESQFITTWNTAQSGSSSPYQITIPTIGIGYDYKVDWGDGNEILNQSGDSTHTYITPGVYTVKISGNFPRIYLNNVGDKLKLSSIEQWGSNEWASMQGAFTGASNMVINATDVPDLSNVTNMDYMLSHTKANSPSISNWDISNVTNAYALFSNDMEFDQPLNNWDVSGITDMSSFFFNTSFNQDINDWDVSNVTNMAGMFETAPIFNKPLNDWDVSNVTSMLGMFTGATNFDQDISDWDVGNVRNMSFMFAQASNFNQDINNWDVGNVTDMSKLFNLATSFNQPLNNWDVSNVTNMDRLFGGADSFNQNINSWNVGNVTNMHAMFSYANSFNQPLNTWVTTNVTDMYFMFSDAYSFDQALNNWDTSNVTDMHLMFSGAEHFNQNINNWDVGNVTNMNSMFENALVYNQPLNNWNVSKVTTLSDMLDGTQFSTNNYDNLLDAWSQLTLKDSANFGTSSTYCNGAIAKGKIVDDFNWTITDGGLDCTSVQSPPSKPLNVSGTPGTSIITLNWDAPSSEGSSPLWYYYIEYKDHSESEWIEYSEPPTFSHSDRSAIVTGLDSAGEYDFRIYAINEDFDDVGPSPYSDVISVTLNRTLQDELGGEGSTFIPFEINSCEELQMISNSPSKSFALTSNIDCSATFSWNQGKGFTPVPIFSGEYFDGRRHIISNLYINRNDFQNVALFGSISDNSEIKNVTLKGGSMTNTWDGDIAGGRVASLVGFNLGRVSASHTNQDINGQNMSFVGGLVATNYVGATILGSSSTGKIQDTGNVSAMIGGLVASNDGTISDTFSTSPVTGMLSGNFVSANCGGLVGSSDGVNILRSYSIGTITCPGTNFSSGGLIGRSQTTHIENNFTAGVIDRTYTGYLGSLVGQDVSGSYSQNYINNFFDIGLANASTCSAFSQNLCTGVNAGSTQPNYFKNTHTNAPLNTWDFTNVWQQNASYPVLRPANIIPDPPEQLKIVSENTAGTAALQWEAPPFNGGSEISDYEIQYRLEGTSTWNVFSDGIAQNLDAQVTGLIPGDDYQFRVRAINPVGPGLFAYTKDKVNLNLTIESPPKTQFEYGDEINYQVVLENTSQESFDSLDTDFLPTNIDINTVDITNPTLGAGASDLGEMSNSNQNWNGLIEPNQTLVFDVTGKVDGMPNETGGLTFVVSNGKLQGQSVPMGEGRVTSITKESKNFEILNTQTDFKLTSRIQEDEIIKSGDTLHIDYTIKNLGPKTGFFTNSAVYIFFPPELNILTIQNDLLLCSVPLAVDGNFSSGIFNALSGNMFTMCVAGNSALLQVNDSFDISVTASANVNFQKNDVLSRGLFIAEQDIDNVSLEQLLSTPSNSSESNSIFAAPINNISTLIYDKDTPTQSSTSTSTTTTTTKPISTQTPGSKDQTTGGKANTSTPKTRVVNRGQIITVPAPIKNSIANSGSYDDLPGVKALLQGAQQAQEKEKKIQALGKVKTTPEDRSSLLWLFIAVAIALTLITIRQAQQNKKSKRLYFEDE